MKRFYLLFLTAAMILGLCACGTVEKNDKGFIVNVQKAFEQREAKAEKLPNSYTSTSAKKMDLMTLNTTEKEIIGDVSEYSFTDPVLKELAEQYVAALDSREEGLMYMVNDDTTFNKLYYREGYYVKAAVISKLVEKYGFKVNSKYNNSLYDLLDDGACFMREQDAVTTLENMTDIALKAEDMYTFSCMLTNPSIMDLENVTVNFSVLDKDGNTVDSGMDYITKWGSGETVKVKPFFSDSNGESYKMSFSFYSTATDISWETEPIDITFERFDPGVEFILRSELPSDYTPSSWYSKATCHVTDFWSELSYAENGVASFTLHIAGSKTYDARGNDYKRSCHVGFSVTNEDNSIVYNSGSFYTDELVVGQSFVDCYSYVSDLAPGTYYVELFSSKY